MSRSNERFINDWTATKASFISHYFPNYEDPGWGHFSEVALAGTIGKFSALIANKALSEKAFELSKQMAEVGVGSLIADWDDDDLCPPPRPHWWNIEQVNGPHPEPWKPKEPHPNWETINAAEQVEIAYLFTKFSALTTSERFNKALKSLATEIARNAAGQLADDFEKCGTPPRPHQLELSHN
jgi:hypothetical protein